MRNRQLELYFAKLKSDLMASDAWSPEIEEELRDHATSQIEELVAQGITEEEAVRQVIGELGSVGLLADSFTELEDFRKKRWMMRFSAIAISSCFVFTILIGGMWPANHRVGLLSNLAGQDPEPTPGAVVPKSATRAERTARTREILENETISVDFVDIPLNDAIVELGERLKVGIVVDKQCLESEGVTTEQPVTLNLNDVRASTVFEMLFRAVGSDIGYTVRDGLVVITSGPSASEELNHKVINVRDLTSKLIWVRKQENGETRQREFWRPVLDMRQIGYGPMGGGGGAMAGAGGMGGGGIGGGGFFALQGLGPGQSAGGEAPGLGSGIPGGQPGAQPPGGIPPGMEGTSGALGPGAGMPGMAAAPEANGQKPPAPFP